FLPRGQAQFHGLGSRGMPPLLLRCALKQVGRDPSMDLKTQVAIIGAGPAGLMLGQLLTLAGIDNIIVEDRSRTYVEGRIRAGLLEQGSVDMLIATGLGERLQREGLRHEGISLRFDGRSHRIDLTELTGRSVTIYGQHEVIKDMIAVRLEAGTPLLFEAL